MSYKISKADGTSIIVGDYEQAIAGNISLLGYGFSNYGSNMAQNLVNLLENNASQTEPVLPALGQFWYQLPADPTTTSKNFLICVDPSASLSSDRWKVIFSVSTSNVVITSPSSSSTQLTSSHIFGSRSGGLSFNGTQDVALTTAHIAEGDQLYYTDARARASISATGRLSYNSSTGVMSYPASVDSFNTRTGTVTLSSSDVTTALTYTPVNKAGDTFTGYFKTTYNNRWVGFGVQNTSGSSSQVASVYMDALNENTIQPASMYFDINPDGSSGWGINLSPAGSRTVDRRQLALYATTTALTYNGNTVWNAGNDGAGSGLDADLLKGLTWTSGQNVSFGETIVRTPNAGTTGGLVLGANATSGFAYIQVLASNLSTQWGYWSHSVAGEANWNGAAGLKHNGNTVWDSANDGAGSGLDADTLDSLQATAFAQLSALGNSLTPNGYAYLPNGLLMQWGQDRQVTNLTDTGLLYTTNFVLGFSAPPFSITVGRISTNTDTYNQKLYVNIGRTDTNFSWKIQDDDSSDGGSYVYGFDWVAIGPA